MLAVALVSAFVTMRLAIHGREAPVPAVTGMTVADAAAAARRAGLQLSVENRFYSSEVPGGHVIAQDPPAGFRVRRDWPVRITESLGAQRVSVPNLVGQSERAAMITIRQLGLEAGAVVHMAAPGDAGVVIAQSPTADGGEVSSPRVSLLVSDGQSAETAAYVMPSLVGLSYAAAVARTSAAGLKLVGSEQVVAAPGPAGAEGTGAVEGASGPVTSGTVVAQSPPAGWRVQAGDVVRVTISRESGAE
jgi:beta-lactam-binding protein with PASTA domain